jgi:2-haloacid dehalogenase
MANYGVAPAHTKITSVLDGFVELPAHPDVRPAFERVLSAGLRIMTLTNGSGESTKNLLSRAGILGFVEESISIDEIGYWKPYRESGVSRLRAAV